MDVGLSSVSTITAFSAFSRCIRTALISERFFPSPASGREALTGGLYQVMEWTKTMTGSSCLPIIGQAEYRRTGWFLQQQMQDSAGSAGTRSGTAIQRCFTRSVLISRCNRNFCDKLIFVSPSGLLVIQPWFDNHELFVPQRLNRIDPHRPPRRNVAGAQCDDT